MPFTEQQKCLWANRIQYECLLASNNDVDAALSAAEYLINTQPIDLSILNIALAVRHAPAGEPTVIGGKTYTPGEFIPDEAWAQATPEEKAQVEGNKPTEPKQKEEGGTTDKRAAMRDRTKAIIEEAAKIEVTDEKIQEGDPVDRNDYEEIEARMDSEQLRDMEIQLQEWRDRSIDESMNDFEPDIDERDVARSLNVDRDDIEEKAAEIFEKYELDAPNVSTRNYGSGAIEQIIDNLDEDAPDALREELTTWKDEVEKQLVDTVEEWEDTQTDEAREAYKNDYDDSEDKENYLRQFHSDNEEMFAGESIETEHNKWYVDSDGDGVLTFETDSGAEYKVSAVYNYNPSGTPIPDMQFSDNSGSFKVTGAGEAFQVFTKVVPAMVAYISKKDLPVATFSAAEESRQKLYDRLVKTVASIVPGYFAAYVNKGTTRYYMIGKVGMKEELLAKTEEKTGIKPQMLVQGIAASLGIDDHAQWNEIAPEVDPAWFTVDGWGSFDPAPTRPLSAFFSHDIHNRDAQGILNRALKSVRNMGNTAKRDLATALRQTNSGAAILAFIDKYRLQLARILTATQLASILKGAQEVAARVPPLGDIPIEGLPVAEQERYLEAQQAKAQFAPIQPNADGIDDLHFPIIDEAVRDLSERNVVTRDQYDQLAAAARAKAFTVANVAATETLEKIRDSLANNVREGADYDTWKEAVLQDVEQGTFMSESHAEVVFRTNVQAGFSDGQMSVLQHPLVRSGFPYSTYDAIHDDRARHNHLAMEHHGINGTNVYRNDDPVFQTFRPPWDYNDRCGWTPITVRQAAERGIPEAKEWMDTGIEPAVKAFVNMPDFRPPEGFQRAIASAPMSIQLSMQPINNFGCDQNNQTTLSKPAAPHTKWNRDDYPRNNANQFLDKYLIAQAATDDGVMVDLCDGTSEIEQSKLHRAIARLQAGETIHHPDEDPGLGVGINGEIVDPDWRVHQTLLDMYQEWVDRGWERTKRMESADEAIKLVRDKEGFDCRAVDACLRHAGATPADMRALSRARHRMAGMSADTKETTLAELYEDAIEAAYQRIEHEASGDREPSEPTPPKQKQAQQPRGPAFGFDPNEKRDASGEWTKDGQTPNTDTENKVVHPITTNPVPTARLAALVASATRMGIDGNELGKRVIAGVVSNLKHRAANPNNFSTISMNEIIDHHVNESMEGMLKERHLKEEADFAAMRKQHLAKEVPPPKKFGASSAPVEVVSKRTPAQVQELVSKIMGKPTALHEVASMVGAPDNAKISVTPGREKNTITIRVQHPDYVSRRTLRRDENGKLEIHNDEFFVKKGAQGKGLGTEVFAKQVETCTALGVDRITCYAAGPPNFNGYTTWPKFGYDCPISALHTTTAQKIKEKFPHAESILDVHMVKGGPEWWIENGVAIPFAEFNLKPESRSLKVLHTYLADKEEKRAAKGITASLSIHDENVDTGNGFENIDLTPEQEAAIKRVWEKLQTESVSNNPQPTHGPAFATDNNNDEEHTNLVAEILVILFGDNAKKMVQRLYKQKQSPPDISLAMVNGVWHGPTPPSPTGWVQTTPGPRGGLRWVPVNGSTPQPTPTPGAQQNTPAATPPATAPIPKAAVAAQAAQAAGTPLRQSQIRIINATAAYNTAMATLQQRALTTTEKTDLAKHLSVMSKQQLRSLHTALGGTAVIVGGQRQPLVHAIKNIINGVTATPVPTVPTPTPQTPPQAAPTPAPTPQMPLPTPAPQATPIGPDPTPPPTPPAPTYYQPPPPSIAVINKVAPYKDPTIRGGGSGGGIPKNIDHTTINGQSSTSIPTEYADTTTTTYNPGAVFKEYTHQPSGYKILAVWKHGNAPATGQPGKYVIIVLDSAGSPVTSYDSYAPRDKAYIEGRTNQVANWLHGELAKLKNQKPQNTISAPLAQFAWDYAQAAGVQPGAVPFKIDDATFGDPTNRAAVEGFLKTQFPKLVGAQQHRPHGGMDTVEHTMNIVNPLNLRTAGLSTRDAEILRLGMVFHDVGKQYDPLDHDHPRKSAVDAEPLLWQFGLNEKETRDTLAVIKWHDAYGDALKNKGTPQEAAKVAKIAYEYADSSLPPAQRKAEAVRINNLLMRAWQSDLSSIPGLTGDPIPGRPDIKVSGWIHVNTEGPKFESVVNKAIDDIATTDPTLASIKSAPLPKKPAQTTVGIGPKPNYVPDGLKWGEKVQRVDQLPIGGTTPYNSMITPPPEVYDEARKNPDLNYARAFNMGYDGPTGTITTVYHGTGKAGATGILSTGIRAGNNGDNVFGHGVYVFANGADEMTSQYSADHIVKMEVHTGRIIDHDTLEKTIVPAWKKAFPTKYAQLSGSSVNSIKTEAALWAGYSTISLAYYSNEPALVIIDPARIRLTGAVGSKSGGYKGQTLNTLHGPVASLPLTADEKKTPKGHVNYMPLKNHVPQGFSGAPRTT